MSIPIADFTNPLNKVFIGDNLPIINRLEHESVDLIYLDPPFNSGSDYGVTSDGQSVFKDIWKYSESEFVVTVNMLNSSAAKQFMLGWKLAFGTAGKAGEELAYLCHMVPRLKAMKAILKPTGSIYLHCDVSASHALKKAMDVIFGATNFRNEIAWCYGSPSTSSNKFPKKHDAILFYAKGGESVFNPNAVLVPHKRIDRRTVREGWRRNKPAEFTREKAGELAKGKMPFSWWDDIAPAYKSAKQFTGYPTQKPKELLTRIIKASSNPGDVVLDPYCGSGTTLAACYELALDGEGRDFIGIDLGGVAAKIAAKLMRDRYDADLEVQIHDEGLRSAVEAEFAKSPDKPAVRKSLDLVM